MGLEENIFMKRNIKLNKIFYWYVKDNDGGHICKITDNENCFELTVDGRIASKHEYALFSKQIGVTQQYAFKPRFKENYYYVRHDGQIICCQLRKSDEHAYRIEKGNYYKTHEEALAHKDKWIELTNDKYNEIFKHCDN